MPTFSMRRQQRGFTLFEVLLALGIAILVASAGINALKNQSEQAQANAAGEQLQMVGQSLNNYIALRYNQIVAMTSEAGAGTAADPGPRTCDAAAMMCAVTSQTLIDNGLLPASFSGVNSFGATYDYYIHVGGVAPNYDVEGLVITSTPYITSGTTPRFDLLGQAMLTAGSDAGMTRNVGTEIDGMNGAWIDCAATGGACTSADWTGCSSSGNPCFDTLGLLAYRAGYGSSAYAAYMRLDGSTPMTGNLNMGGNSILNVSNIAATGTITANNVVTNPGPTALVLDSSSNGTTFATGTGSLAIRNNNGVLIQNTAGTAPGNLSAGVISGTNGSYSGSLAVAGNISSGGTVSGSTLSASSLVYSGGNLQAAGNILANGNVVANGTVTGNGIISNGNVTANGGNLVTSGDYGWLNSTYGGGWYMSDSTWIRAVNNKGILTAGDIEGGTLIADNQLQFTNAVTAGTGCSPTGATAMSASGVLLSCVGGTWVSAAGNYANYTAVYGATEGSGTASVATCPAGYTLISGGYQTMSGSIPGGPTVAQPISNTQYEVITTDTTYGLSYRAVAYCGQ